MISDEQSLRSTLMAVIMITQVNWNMMFCVMMPFEEQVDKWFKEALQMVDEDCVIGHWFGTLGKLHPTVHYHEVSKYLDPSY